MSAFGEIVIGDVHARADALCRCCLRQVSSTGAAGVEGAGPSSSSATCWIVMRRSRPTCRPRSSRRRRSTSCWRATTSRGCSPSLTRARPGADDTGRSGLAARGRRVRRLAGDARGRAPGTEGRPSGGRAGVRRGDQPSLARSRRGRGDASSMPSVPRVAGWRIRGNPVAARRRMAAQGTLAVGADHRTRASGGAAAATRPPLGDRPWRPPRPARRARPSGGRGLLAAGDRAQPGAAGAARALAA